MSTPPGQAHPSRSRRRPAYGLAVTAAACVAFVIALVRFLPVDPFLRPVVDEIATRSGVAARYRHSHLVWRGISLTDLEIAAVGATAAPPALVVETLVMEPSLMSLLRRRGGFPWRVVAQLPAGSATGWVHGEPSAWRADIDWQGIDLARLPLGGGTVTVAGMSDGHIEISGPVPEAGDAVGSWRISGNNVSATGLRSGQLLLPQIGLGKVESSGTWQGARLTIASLRTDGPLGSASLSGRVVLRSPIEQSALNLRLTHSPPAAGPTDLSGMARLLLPSGGAAGAGRPRAFHVGGTLGLPAIRPED